MYCNKLRIFISFVMWFVLASSSALFAQSPAPAFSSDAPESGITGNMFVIITPLENNGGGGAANVSITSAALGSISPAAPSFPIPLGPWPASSAKQLVLQFAAGSLVIGNRYLLTVRGTYEFGGVQLGLAISRIVQVTTATGSTLNDINRWIALDAIREEWESVFALGIPASGQAMLAFLQGRPEFIEPGMSADGTTVWAKFADGLQIVVGFDSFSPQDQAASKKGSVRAASPSASLSPNAADGGELPASSTFRFLDVFPSLDDASLVPDLTQWMIAQSYTPVNGASATVAALRAMNGSNDGIFLIRTHGAVIQNGTQKVYALWTSEPFTLDSPASDFDDAFAKPERLVIYEAAVAHNVPEWHWAITPAFVNTYWKPGTFSANSLVYFDACQSDVDANWKAAIMAAGASVYAGWSDDTKDRFASETARLVFDRLLGANEFCPETSPNTLPTLCVPGKANPPIFPQRPFTYASVVNTEYLYHDLGFNTDLDSKIAGTKLIFTPSAEGSGFGLLAPSISYMVMNEGDDSIVGEPGQLTIYGIFGNDPGEGGSVQVGGTIEMQNGIPVVIGGKSVDIESWNLDHIVVDLPLSGTGSAGNVQVAANGHVSNVAQLTEWRNQSDQFAFTLNSAGSLQQQQNFAFHLRADIRKWRKVIHDPPTEPFVIIISANDSMATVSSTGSASGLSVTESWTGSPALVNLWGSPGVSNNFFAFVGGAVDSEHMSFGVVVLSQDGLTCKVCEPGLDCTTSNLTVSGPASWFGLWTSQPIYFTADFDYSGDTVFIKNGSMSGSGIGIGCSSLSDKARGNFTWASIASEPDTAPDPHSAR